MSIIGTTMRLIGSLFLALSGASGLAQIKPDDLSFLKHLESIEAYEEGLIFLSGQRSGDTAHFYSGKFNYYLKNRTESVYQFDQVSPSNTDYWNASQFYSGLQYAYLNDFKAAATRFGKPYLKEPILLELQKLELAGIALLERDLKNFHSISENFDSDFYQLKTNQDAMIYAANKLQNRKTKSPLVAGLMSAVIPGSGKYYLGKLGQGTLSLVTSAIFGLQAYEGYRNDGIKSPTFIVFGSLFSVFYVANIWGSVVAVRVDRNDFNETQDETILLHMHIPVRLLLQ